MTDAPGPFDPRRAAGPPPAPPWPTEPPPGPARTGAGNRSLLLALAVLLLLGGLAAIVTPFGNWVKVSFAGIDATVNGYGMEDSGLDDDGDAGLTESSDDSDDDSLDWLASPIPDGMPITGLGFLVGGLSLFLLLRILSPPADTERSRKEILGTSAAIAGPAGIGFLWVAMSWFNLNGQWEDAISESMEESDLGFGAMFAAGIDFEPGYGLILSGLAMAGLAAVAVATFLVSFSRMEKMPIAVTFATTPSADASGPSSGQWAPTPPPPPAGP